MNTVTAKDPKVYLASVAVALAIAGCNPGKSGLPGAAAATAQPVPEGIYTVCHVGSDLPGHNNRHGDHLVDGQKIEIRAMKIDDASAAALVCLDSECPANPNDAPPDTLIWMVNDQKQLSGARSFKHDAIDGNDPAVQITHLVQIENLDEKPGEFGECDGPNNILTMRFCVREDKKWDCAFEPHAGHAHVEN
jgi:hypothetical protein